MAWTLVFAAVLAVGRIFLTIHNPMKLIGKDSDGIEVEGPKYVGRLRYRTPGPIKFNLDERTGRADQLLSLSCMFEVYNDAITEVEWILQRNGQDDLILKGFTFMGSKTNNMVFSTYTFEVSSNMFDVQNGTYVCRIWDSYGAHYLTGQTDVLIYARPEVNIEFAKAISSSEIYLNWTVRAYNYQIKGYNLTATANTSFVHIIYPIKINGTENFYVVPDLLSNTSFAMSLVAETYTLSKAAHLPNTAEYPNSTVMTLPEDPMLQPTIVIHKAFSASIWIERSDPPLNVAEYVHFYELQTWKADDPETITTAYHVKDDEFCSHYRFENLDSWSTHVFRARTCFEYGIIRCSDWSNEIEAETIRDILNESSSEDRPIEVYRCWEKLLNVTTTTTTGVHRDHYSERVEVYDEEYEEDYEDDED